MPISIESRENAEQTGMPTKKPKEPKVRYIWTDKPRYDLRNVGAAVA
jgi:hypothetical protein